MAIQIVTNQIKDAAVSNDKIANSTIQPAKIDLSQLFAFGQLPTVSADAVSGNQLVRKSQLDSVVNGLSWKAAARCKSTGDVDISSAPSAIDGVTLSSSDRVLLASQSTGSENGIYVFASAGSAMVRADDADAFAEIQDGTAIFIKEGTQNAGLGYQQSATLSSFSSQNWILFSATGGGRQADGTKGLDLVGNTFSCKVDDSTVNFDASGRLRVKDAGIVDAKIANATISNSKLVNNQITVTAGSGLAGGGNAALGGSTSLAVQADSSNTIAVSGSGIGVADASIGAGKLATSAVETAKIDDAAVTLAKLQAFNDGQIAVGNGSNRPALVSVSGDVSLANTGAMTIQANAITTAKVQDAQITNAKLASSAVNLVAGNGLSAGSVALGGSVNVELVLDGSTLAKGGSGLKVGNDAITAAQIAANAITASELANDAVDTDAIAAEAVTSAKIAADAVTLAKAGFSFSQQKFTGTTSLFYDLSATIESGFEDAAFVFRNGLLCERVSSSPSDSAEYTLVRDGGLSGVARITFGGSVDGEKITVKFMQ